MWANVISDGYLEEANKKTILMTYETPQIALPSVNCMRTSGDDFALIPDRESVPITETYSGVYKKS